MKDFKYSPNSLANKNVSRFSTESKEQSSKDYSKFKRFLDIQENIEIQVKQKKVVQVQKEEVIVKKEEKKDTKNEEVTQMLSEYK